MKTKLLRRLKKHAYCMTIDKKLKSEILTNIWICWLPNLFPLHAQLRIIEDLLFALQEKTQDGRRLKHIEEAKKIVKKLEQYQ